MPKGCKASSWLRSRSSSSSHLLQLTLIQRCRQIFLAPRSLNLIPACPAQCWLVTVTDMLPLGTWVSFHSAFPDSWCWLVLSQPTETARSELHLQGWTTVAPLPGLWLGFLAHVSGNQCFVMQPNITHFCTHSQGSLSLFENNPFISFLLGKQTLGLHYFIVQVNNVMIISTHSVGADISVVLSPRLLQQTLQLCHLRNFSALTAELFWKLLHRI